MHLLDGVVNALYWVVLQIDKPIGNLGWTMIILAGLIRLLFWPLNTAQFKAFMNMQKVAPMLKRLQERYKDDKQRQQQETMALYKEQGINPLAGCWPMLVQYPVIISVYYVVLNHKPIFATQSWLWIGSVFSHGASIPALFGTRILAQNLAAPDLFLVLFYALSMYLSVRYVSVPATDPQAAQMQRNMAYITPVMLGFVGWRYHWPSAMVLYWCSYNIFTMGQQFYLLRRYHQPLSLIDSEHAITADVPASKGSAKLPPAATRGNGAVTTQGPKPPRAARAKRKNKKGS